MSETHANSGDMPVLPISDELIVTVARFAGINHDTYGVPDTPSIPALQRYAAQNKNAADSDVPAATQEKE